MKNYPNAQEELLQMYEAARQNGKAHTKKEFAEMLGINPANMSGFVSGYTSVTAQMMRRIKDAASLAGIYSPQTIETNNGTAVGGGDVLGDNAQKILEQQTDPRWFELVKEKDKQIDRLLGIIEKLQA